MSLFPKSTSLGNLEMIEVYEYYDKPCLFSCRNGVGQIFLGVWVDETPDSDIWFYVPMSLKRFQYVRSGGIDLKDAFMTAEDGFIFKVITPFGDIPSNIITIPCETVNEDWLPMAGEFLNCSSETLDLLHTQKASLTAMQLRREVLHLTLEFPSIQRMEAPIADLGVILQSLQHLLNAIGQVKAGRPTILGKIPKQVITQTELAVIGTFAGSFGVEIVASTQADLFGDSLIGNAIEELLKLVNIGSNAEELRNCLLKLKSRSASRYRDFLQSLVDARTELNLDWGSPKQNRGDSAELSLFTAKAIIEIINQIQAETPEEYEVTGELIGANKRTKTYEIRDIDTNTKYSGRILDEAMSDVETATLGQIYIAVIREVLERLPITGEEKVKYELVSLGLFEFEELLK